MRTRILRFLNALPTWLMVLISLLLLLLAWQALVTIGGYPPFILPGPRDVGQQFLVVVGDGRLIKHSLVTISEVIPGLLIGCLIAMPLGYFIAKSALVDRLLSPYLVASQAIPVIAIAPLLAIWVSSTYWARVWVAVLVVFFPILVSIIAGLRAVPAELYELMGSLQASKWQTFRKLEFPSSLPILLAGLKVGATLAVIGTLVGEFVQPKSSGLGFMLVTARYQFKTDLVFVILITLSAIALCLYGLVALLEKRLLHWR